jgi:signal transduction histidine kinase
MYRDYPQIIATLNHALAGNSVRYSINLDGIYFETLYNPVYDATGQVTGAIGVAMDITNLKAVEAAMRQSEAQLKQQTQALEQTLSELQRTQTQLVQSEKMSSLGQLVAGIAHEINNPINFIFGNITYIEEYANDLLELLNCYQQNYVQPAAVVTDKLIEVDLEFIRDDLPKVVNSLKVGSERIQEIVKSLRVFSRLDEAEIKAVDIHEGIDSTLLILQSRLKARADYPAIKVMKNYGILPLVECYAGQLNQVFMNIIANAIDALEERYDQAQTQPEVDPVSLEISIGTEQIEPDWIRITIADSGCGIPEELRSRIFDPFFTTKPVGKGTGMGMSISYQIITQKHHGRLYCDASVENGTAFMIEIPTCSAMAIS